MTRWAQRTASLAFAALAALVVAPAAPASAGGGEAAARAPGFVEGIDDLPLLPGLSAAHAEAVVFDTPAGRIVEAYATGTAAPSQVLQFYAETLPQLGWSPNGEGRYVRGDESLAIDFPAGRAGGVLTVRFTLAPAQ